jgi:hypothetical protein
MGRSWISSGFFWPTITAALNVLGRLPEDMFFDSVVVVAVVVYCFVSSGTVSDAFREDVCDAE